jgi:hypothetical protein
MVGDKAGAAIGGRETPICVEASGLRGRGSFFGIRPLLRALFCQKGMAEAGVIAEAICGKGGKFCINLCRGLEGKLRFKAQPAPHFSKDLPIGSGFARGISKGLTKGNPALGVGHHPGFLAPLAGGQKQMGIFCRFCRVISLLVNGKGRLFQGFFDPFQIRKLTKGLVATIQKNCRDPVSRAAIISVALSPGQGEREPLGKPQACSTSARCWGWLTSRYPRQQMR